jgi:hypothetical protein
LNRLKELTNALTSYADQPSYYVIREDLVVVRGERQHSPKLCSPFGCFQDFGPLEHDWLERLNRGRPRVRAIFLAALSQPSSIGAEELPSRQSYRFPKVSDPSLFQDVACDA